MQKKIRTILCIFTSSALFFTCAKAQGKTEYRERQLADAGRSYTYEEWVAAIGREKTEYLYSHNGAELNLLASGAGVSNIVLLLNQVGNVAKISALLGNDADGSGLGAARLLRLMNRVDFFMTQNRYDTAAPADQDTIGDLVALIDDLASVAIINTNVVALVNAMGVTRALTDANDEAKIDKIAVLVAHLNPLHTLPPLLNEISPAAVTTNLKDLLLGVNSGNHLVDVVENVANAQTDNHRRLVYLLDNINASATQILVHLINEVETPKATPLSHASRTKLYALVNALESGLDWSAAGGQPKGIQTFNLTTTTPAGADSGFPRLVTLLNKASVADAPKLAYLIENLSDGTGTAKLVRLIQDIERIEDLANDANDGIVELLANPSGNDSVKNLTDLAEQIAFADFSRVCNFVNGMQGNGIGGSAAEQAVFRNQVAALLIALPNGEIGKITGILTNLTLPGGLANLVRVAKDATTAKLATLVVQVNVASYLTYLVDNTVNAAHLVTIINGTADTAKLAAVVNQVGLPGNLSRIAYLINNLTTPHMAKVPALIDNTTVIARLIDLINLVDDGTSPAGIVKLNELVRDTTTISDLYPLINGVNAIADVANLVNAVPTIARVVSLVNNITDDAKLVPLINGNPYQKLAYLINTVPTAVKIAELIENTLAAKMPHIVALINGMTGANAIDLITPGQRMNATGLGKLVNLIEYTPSRVDIAEMLNELVAANHTTRLLEIINPLANSTNLVCLLTELTSVSYSSGSDLGKIIVGLDDDFNDPKKLRLIVENITQCQSASETAGGVLATADFRLLAELMGAEASVNQGSGFATIVILIQRIREDGTDLDAAAIRLASVLKGVAANLRYNSVTANIPRREGFVRLLNHSPGAGIVKMPESVSFPGLGPRHLATMINLALDAADIVSLVNGNDLTAIVPLVGCTDRVGDPDPSQPGNTLNPDFFTPCNGLGLAGGWLP